MLNHSRLRRGRSRPLDPAEEKVARLVLLRCGVHGPDLEDSLQEIQVRALRFAPGDGQLCPWVGRVASNVAMDHHRARRRDQKLVAMRAAGWPSTTNSPDPNLRPLAAEILRILGPEHREVVALRVLGGLSVDETAAVLDIPEGTVKSRLHRALATLRLHLREHEDLAWTA